MDEFPQEIATLFIKCFSQLSIQVPIYASLIALLHNIHKQTNFASLIVVQLQQQYIEQLSKGAITTAKLLLRALASLTCARAFALEGAGGLLEVLESLYLIVENSLPNNSEEGEELAEDGRECAFLLAHTLLWTAEANGVFLQSAAGTAFQTKCVELFEAMLKSYASPFGAGHRQAMLYRYAAPEDESDVSVPLGLGLQLNDSEANGWRGGYDTLWEALSVAVEVLRNGNNDARGMLRPWLAIDTLGEDSPAPLRFSEAFEGEFLGLIESPVGLGHRAKHAVPQGGGGHVVHSVLGEASLYGRGYGWLQGRVVLFTTEANAQVAALATGLTRLEKLLLTQYYSDILCYFDPVINEDGTKLGSLELLTQHLMVGVSNLFLGIRTKDESGMEQDQVQQDGENDKEEKATEIKEENALVLEYVLVELLMQLLLQQPSSSSQSVYVSRVLLFLCKKFSTIPPIVALATNVLYLLLPDITALTITQQLSDWFVFHLLNTQFAWPFWDFMLGEAGFLAQKAETMDDSGDGDEKTEPVAVYFAFFEAVCSKLQLLVSQEHYHKSLPRELVAVFPYTTLSFVPLSPLFNRVQGEASSAVSSGMVVSLSEAEGGEKCYLGALFQKFTQSDEIRVFSAQVKARLAAREHCDEMIEWLEALPSLAEEVRYFPRTIDNDLLTFYISYSQGNELVYSRVFLEALLYVAFEGETLTVLLGLLDQYHDLLLAIGDAPVTQLMMLETLFTLYPLEPAGPTNSTQVLVILDEMLRRQQLQAVSVVRYLAALPGVCSPALLSSSSAYWRAWQLASDRSLDIAKASVFHRLALTNATALPHLALHGQADLAPEDMPVAVVMVDEEERTKEDSRGGKRRRLESGEGDEEEVDYEADENDNQNEGMDAEKTATGSDGNPVWEAEEGIKSAVRNTRAVYTIVVSFVLHQLNQSATAADAEDWRNNLCISALHRALRAYFGLQAYLSYTLQQPVALVDVVSSVRLLTELQQIPAFSAVVKSWQKHLRN